MDSLTVTAAVSDTGFTGPVSNFAASSSGTFQQVTGGTITLNYSDDPANGQGAIIPTDTPGTLVSTFSTVADSDAFSLSNSQSGTFSASGPFSITEQAIYTIPAGAFCSTEILTNVPEASTWAMMLLGFARSGFRGLSIFANQDGPRRLNSDSSILPRKAAVGRPFAFTDQKYSGRLPCTMRT
jgi:hypothetical protein